MADFTIQVIANDGLGFGEGSIGVTSRKAEDAGNPIDNELLRRVDEAIESHEILVPVDTDDTGEPVDDDGCGDGRGVKVVMQGTEIKKRSLNRPKVFGGGLTMGVAARIGTGEAQDSLHEEFATEISEFADKELNFGGLTDEHANDEKCGCGAIDKAPQIVAAAVAYRAEIAAAAAALTGIPAEENTALTTALDRYEAYAQRIVVRR